MGNQTSLPPLEGDNGIVIVSLGDAGKTSILYRLSTGTMGHATPTLGFKPNTIKVKEYPPVTVWEVGMGHMINDCLWRHYMPRKNGLVFVVDSVDHNRLGEARSFLNLWHNDRAPKGLPLLICANKQDLPDALSVSELIDRLGLKDLHGRPWHIKATSAATGMGVQEGFEWMLITIQSQNHKTPLNEMQRSEIQMLGI